MGLQKQIRFFLAAIIISQTIFAAIVYATPTSTNSKELSSVAQSNKDDTHKMLKAGVQKFSTGDKKGAADIFAKVIAEDPHNVDAFYNLGALAEQRRDYRTALQDYEVALDFNPKDKELQQAVVSMRNKLEINHTLVGTARFNDALVDCPIVGSRTRFTVNLDPHQKQNVATARGKTSLSRTALGTILSVGAGVAPIPEPFHCPVCSWLRRF